MTERHWDHWDQKFRSREWGRYPPEDLVRFFGRNFRDRWSRESTNVLEVGCGTGANLWFLHREGFQVAGIDGSAKGIEIAEKRLKTENIGLNSTAADLMVGNFERLPWPDNSFDVVIDIFALYANPSDTIANTLHEIRRVLKPGGMTYAKMFGKNTTGFGEGEHLGGDSYQNVPVGPLCDMGVCTFFDASTADAAYRVVGTSKTDTLQRTDGDATIQELMVFCQG